MAYDFPSSPVAGQVYAPAGGPSWTWDGTAWTSYQNAGEMAINRIAIPGPASYTYNKPLNLRHLEFEGCGGGASGSAAIATGAGVYSHGASGGGGAWGKRLFKASELSASTLVTVGAGGAASSAAGLSGGATIFAGLINLPGGIGGPQGANTTGTGVIGPASMTAAPTGVDFGSPGAQGGMSGIIPSAWNFIGPSGHGPYGAPTAFLISSNGQVGAAGYGSGSSGCYNTPSAGLKASAAGNPGIVILTEYLAVAPADLTEPTVVKGPASARGNYLASFDGDSGKLIKDSGIYHESANLIVPGYLQGTALYIGGTTSWIRQGHLVTNYAGQNTTALISLVTLYGGYYGFEPVCYANASNVYFASDLSGFQAIAAGSGYVARNLGASAAGVAYFTFGTSPAAASTIYANQQYVLASPPYDLGDGEVPLFAYVLMHKDGTISGASVAPDPPWANNGNGHVVVSRYSDDGKKAYTRAKDVKLAGLSKREQVAAFAEAPWTEVEITMAMKIANAKNIPHPWISDPSVLDGSCTPVLLDPVSPLMHELAEWHRAGNSVLDLIHHNGAPKDLKIGNAALKRAGPKGLKIVSATWK